MSKQKWKKWARTAAGFALAAALVLCLIVPALRSRAAVPENPIRDDNISAIRTLSLGDEESGLREETVSGTPDESETSQQGQNGQEQTDTPPEQTDTPETPEEPDPPEEPDQPQPPDTPETPPDPQPGTPETPDPEGNTQPDDPGDGEPLPGDGSTSGTDGDPGSETLPGGEETLPGDVDLGLVLYWYKYGREEKGILCPGGSAVTQTILTTQLPEGVLRYHLELTGEDASQAQLTELTLTTAEDTENLSRRGELELALTPRGGRTEYDIRAQARYVQVFSDGTQLEQLVTFRIVLVYEDGLDLELEMCWQLASGGEAAATCMPGRTARRTVESDRLEDGLLEYDFFLLGDSADQAELLEVTYSASHGETGQLRTRGGVLPLQCAEGEEEAVYTVTGLAEVNNGGAWQELEFTFVLTWKQTLDLQLSFTWLKNGVEPQTLVCQPEGRASGSMQLGELRQNTLEYQLALTGDSAPQATITSVQYTDSGGSRALSCPDGQVKLTIPEGAFGEKCTFTVQARYLQAGGGLRTVTFTVILRCSGQVRLQMEYTLKNGETRRVLCENGRSRTEEPLYDDELTDNILPFTVTLLGGEGTDALSIVSAECYQSGSGRTVPLGSGGESLSGSAVLLTNSDGSTGENTFLVTAESASGQRYSFSVNLPLKHRGEGVVQLRLNVTDGQTVTNETELTLTVEAWSETADGRLISRILANGQTVTLDGEPVRCSGSAGYVQQYTLIPKNPEMGDENEHILVVTGEDDFGNYGEVTLRLPGQRTELGAVKGSASIYIDMSVLGLGITEVHGYQVLSGEPASYAVAKAVWGYDAGEIFGTAEDTFGWPEDYADYNGSLDSQFYLTRLGDGTNMARRANALRGLWRDYGSTSEEILARIDEIFGENSPYAALWRSIYLRGYQMNGAEDYSVGEFDFTQASGWMYSIGGGTFYPGTALSGYELEDGDVLVLRYTLAYGSDIGGGQRGSDFCVTFLNGKGQVNHDYQEETVDGHTRLVCSSCGKVQECPHTHAEMQDCGDGTCAYYCPDCGNYVSQPEEHDWEYHEVEMEEFHEKHCRRCGVVQEEAHGWSYQACTATCAQDGENIYLCTDCGMERREPVPAQGHRPDLHSDGLEHWEVCSVCGEEVPGSLETHSYVWDGFDWCCEVCWMYHGDVCFGNLHPMESECDCSHETVECSDCGMVFVREEDGAFADSYPHVFADGECIFCGEPDPDWATEPEPEPEPDPEPDPGTENNIIPITKQKRRKQYA